MNLHAPAGLWRCTHRCWGFCSVNNLSALSLSLSVFFIVSISSVSVSRPEANILCTTALYTYASQLSGHTCMSTNTYCFLFFFTFTETHLGLVLSYLCTDLMQNPNKLCSLNALHALSGKNFRVASPKCLDLVTEGPKTVWADSSEWFCRASWSGNHWSHPFHLIDFLYNLFWHSLLVVLSEISKNPW